VVRGIECNRLKEREGLYKIISKMDELYVRKEYYNSYPIISSAADAVAAAAATTTAEKKKRVRPSVSKDKYPRKKVDTCTNNATTAASTNDTKLHGTQI